MACATLDGRPLHAPRVKALAPRSEGRKEIERLIQLCGAPVTTLLDRCQLGHVIFVTGAVFSCAKMRQGPSRRHVIPGFAGVAAACEGYNGTRFEGRLDQSIHIVQSGAIT